MANEIDSKHLSCWLSMMKQNGTGHLTSLVSEESLIFEFSGWQRSYFRSCCVIVISRSWTRGYFIAQPNCCNRTLWMDNFVCTVIYLCELLEDNFVVLVHVLGILKCKNNYVVLIHGLATGGQIWHV
jgi:hypothetical protein